MTIEAIVAIGNQGQIGLNGKLPWHDPEDLKWFREMTMGKTCIVGYNTAQTLPDLPGRRVICDSDAPCEIIIKSSQLHSDHVIIIGGAKTYQRWAPYITRWHIGRIDYDGPADSHFNLDWVLTMAASSDIIRK